MASSYEREECGLNQPMAWWEGWPLTCVVVVLTVGHYGWLAKALLGW